MPIVQPGTDQLDFGALLKSVSPEDKLFILRNFEAVKRILDAILARLTAAGIP